MGLNVINYLDNRAATLVTSTTTAVIYIACKNSLLSYQQANVDIIYDVADTKNISRTKVVVVF